MSTTNFMYALDVECSNSKNIIREEAYVVNTADNDYRLIIPMSGPFYAKDFALQHVQSQRPLSVGVDYELTEPYIDLNGVGADCLYSGAVLINNELKGQFEVTYHTIGGPYVMPSVAVVDYLVNHLNDPVGIQWLHIANRLTQYAPVEHTFNWHDNQNTNHTADAIKDLGAAIDESAENATNVFGELTVKLNALQSLVDSTKFNEHIVNLADPHKVTPAQAHALPMDASAQNAMMVYSKTLLELSQYMVQNGVNDTVLSNYLDRNGSNTVLKSLHMGDGNFSIKNSGLTASISLDNDQVMLTCKGSSLIRADTLSAGNKTAAIECGPNRLQVASSGNGQSDNAATLNGNVIITARNISEYFQDLDQDSVLRLHIVNGDDVRFSGTGTVNHPLSAEVDINLATTHVPGITTIHTVLDDTTNKAAASTLTYAVAIELSKKVPKVRRINNQPLTNDVTITKSHIGLSNIDNTSPANKPLSTAQIAELAKYSDVGHKHSFTQMGTLPDAAADEIGIAKLVNNHTDSSKSGALLTPFALKALQDENLIVNESAKSLLPIRLDIDQYGGSSYLPLPVMGAYGAAGIPTWKAIAGTVEDDGKFVFLRTGMDMVESGVYYFYCDQGDDGSLLNIVTTSTRYKPLYLDGTDRTVKGVCVGGDNIMIIQLDNDDYHVVLQNNTMDSVKHRGAKVNFDGDNTPGQYMHVFLDGGYVYFLISNMSNSTTTACLYRVSEAAVFNGTETTVTNCPLSGTQIDGRRVSNSKVFGFTRNGIVNAGTPQASDAPICIKDDQYWTSLNWRHSECNAIIANKPGHVRCLTAITSYASNAFTSKSDYFSLSYSINLATMEVVGDNYNTLPHHLDRSGLHTGSAEGNVNINGFPTSSANCNAKGFFSRGQWFSARYFGNMIIPTLYNWQDRPDVTPYDGMNANGRYVVNVHETYFQGAYGSAVKNNPRGLAVMAGSYLVGICNDGSKFKSKYTTLGYGENWQGLGPSLDRVTLSDADYVTYKSVPSYWDGANFVNSGFVATNVLDNQPTHWDGNEFSGSVSLTAGSRKVMLDKMGDAVAKVIPKNTWAYIGGTFYKFGDGECFCGIVVTYYNTAARDTKHQNILIYRCSYTYSGSSVVNVTPGELVLNSVFRTQGVSSESVGNILTTEGSSCYKTKDGGTVYQFMNNPYVIYVGNGCVAGATVLKDGNTYEGRALNVYHYSSYGSVYVSELGSWGTLSTDSTAEYVSISMYDNTKAGWRTPTRVSTKSIISTRVPSGWILYFTTKILLVMHNTSTHLPSASLNLEELFPTNHANRTFYIYVTMDEYDQPSYAVKDSLEDDTADQLYIGTCRTSATQIIDINVFKAMRFGKFREIQTHMDDDTAHGLGNYTKEDIGLGNCVNGILINQLSEVPDGADKRNYYMSSDLVSRLSTIANQPNLQVFSGEIATGGTLPIPSGYTKEECNFFVSLKSFNDTMQGMVNWSCNFNPNTLVVTTEVGNRTVGPYTYPCNWWCVVVRK